MSYPHSHSTILSPFPFQGVGGTVHLPKGYLKKAYEVARESGGLCVADEVHTHTHFFLSKIIFPCEQVQTGFGRLGSHYWGFESHGVVPDIG